MKYLNVVTMALALAGGAVGLCAAYYWFKASKVEIDPGWRSGPPRSAADALKPIEPCDSELSQMGWMTATMAAVTESAALNKTAAWLTAVAVAFGVASSILGFLQSTFNYILHTIHKTP